MKRHSESGAKKTTPMKVGGGPLAGFAVPLHGGSPDLSGCRGCTDCCTMPEISVTDAEATTLKSFAFTLGRPSPQFRADSQHPEWQVMLGPCVFRQQLPLGSGGCAIYEDRPGACVVFTCSYLLGLKRAARR